MIQPTSVRHPSSTLLQEPWALGFCLRVSLCSQVVGFMDLCICAGFGYLLFLHRGLTLSNLMIPIILLTVKVLCIVLLFLGIHCFYSGLLFPYLGLKIVEIGGAVVAFIGLKFEEIRHVTDLYGFVPFTMMTLLFYTILGSIFFIIVESCRVYLRQKKRLLFNFDRAMTYSVLAGTLTPTTPPRTRTAAFDDNPAYLWLQSKLAVEYWSALSVFLKLNKAQQTADIVMPHVFKNFWSAWGLYTKGVRGGARFT